MRCRRRLKQLAGIQSAAVLVRHCVGAGAFATLEINTPNPFYSLARCYMVKNPLLKTQHAMGSKSNPFAVGDRPRDRRRLGASARSPQSVAETKRGYCSQGKCIVGQWRQQQSCGFGRVQREEEQLALQVFVRAQRLPRGEGGHAEAAAERFVQGEDVGAAVSA